MKVNRKNLGILSVILLLIVCFAAYIALSSGQKYGKVSVRMLYASDTLVTSKDLSQYIRTHCQKITGVPKRNVNLQLLESQIRHWPFCDSVNIHTDLHGNVNVEVMQVKPLVRIINQKGKSFYLARSGRTAKMLPYLPQHPVRILLANGNIPDAYHPEYVMEIQDTSVCNDLFAIASYIDSHPFWKAQISQIYVVRKGQYRLAPEVGDHLIVLGSARDLDKKFNNLLNIYRQGFYVTGWQRYSLVKLQFGDRVPCEKRVQ